MIAGRDFDWSDVWGRRRFAIVSENMARETWGGAQAAIGKRIRVGRDAPWSEVVGVVEDIHAYGLHEAAPATVYARAGVEEWPNSTATARRAFTYALRSNRAGSQAFVREIAAAVAAVNASIPLSDVRTLRDLYRKSLARTAFTLVLLGIASAMALALAIMGVYGVLAYAVAERRREVGIRLALGARQGSIRSLFVRQGLILTLAGVLAGLAAAGVLSRWLSSILFGVKPLDLSTYAAAAGVIALAALLASYIPARRAALLDPIQTLRAE